MSHIKFTARYDSDLHDNHDIYQLMKHNECSVSVLFWPIKCTDKNNNIIISFDGCRCHSSV